MPLIICRTDDKYLQMKQKVSTVVEWTSRDEIKGNVGDYILRDGELLVLTNVLTVSKDNPRYNAILKYLAKQEGFKCPKGYSNALRYIYGTVPDPIYAHRFVRVVRNSQ